MKTLGKHLMLASAAFIAIACTKNSDPVANNVTLHFNNTFENTTIVLGDAASSTATAHTSAEGQVHRFSELKYVVSNIRLVKADGNEIPYHIHDLDKGATVVDHAKPHTLDFVLRDFPAGEYQQIKFGLGVRSDLNTLDEAKFPAFYAAAGANDTEMMWEWGTGYRFTKIEGFYEADHKVLSIHTGSTVEGEADDPDSYTQGVDAYREIALRLPSPARVGNVAPRLTIKADFDHLLSGTAHTIILGEGNATPSVHTAVNMTQFVDNLGGNGSNDLAGMFSVSNVEN